MAVDQATQILWVGMFATVRNRRSVVSVESR